jgi:hypothetical protein
MMTVRYPSGLSITYNEANWLVYKTDSAAWELYTRNPKSGGFWVASIQNSAGALVEVRPACRVEQVPRPASRKR